MRRICILDNLCEEYTIPFGSDKLSTFFTESPSSATTIIDSYFTDDVSVETFSFSNNVHIFDQCW